MKPTDPQFVYVVITLPALFSLVLIGEGLSELVRGEMSGLISVIIGVAILIFLTAAYFLFSAYFVQRL